MFTRSGRPRSAINIFGHVAWGTSVGGLALIAEERRRRIAIAQKIIENGRILQSYKSYQTPAELSQFDLGEAWDSSLPNLPQSQDKDTEDSFPRYSLTNEEWRSRPRKHRPMPTTSLSKANSAPQVNYSSSPKTSNSSPPPASEASPNGTLRERYESQLQSIVARRAQSCLKADEEHVRRRGMNELSRFLQQDNVRLGEETTNILGLLRDCDGPRDSVDIVVGLQEELAKTLSVDATQASTSSDHYKPDTSNKLEAESRVSRVDKSEGSVDGVVQAALCDEMIMRIKNGQLSEAFYVFLSMCEEDIGALTESSLSAIKDLVAAYKDLDVYSVVKYIDQQLLSVFGIWYQIYLDFAWLVERETPQAMFKLCIETTGSLKSFDQLDRAAEMSVIAGEHVLIHKYKESLRNYTTFFVRFFNNSSEDEFSADPAVFRLANELHHAVVSVGPTSRATLLSNYLSTHSSKTAAIDFYQPISELLDQGDAIHATREYLNELRYHPTPIEVYSPLHHRRVFEAALDEDLFTTCNELMNILVDLKLPPSQYLISSFVRKLKQRLVLPESSNLPTERSSLFEMEETLTERQMFQLMDVMNSMTEIEFKEPRFWSRQLRTLKLALLEYSASSGHVDLGIFTSLFNSQEDAKAVVSCLEVKQPVLRYSHETLKSLSIDHLLLLLSLSRSHPNLRMEPRDIIRALEDRRAQGLIIELFNKPEVIENLDQNLAVAVYQVYASAGSPVQILEFLKHMPSLQSNESSISIDETHFLAMRTVWKKTSNIDLVRNVYQAIKAAGPLEYPTTYIYNVMIQCCVEAGCLEEAQELADEMLLTAKRKPSNHTFDLLSLARALDEDWEGVDATLERMKSHGLLTKSSNISPSRHFFGKTFREYLKHHDTETSMKYALRVYDDYGVPISDSISYTLMYKIVSEEKPDLLTNWKDELHERGLQPLIGTNAINLLLHRIRQSSFLKYIASSTEVNLGGLNHSERSSKLVSLLDHFTSQSSRDEHNKLPKTRLPEGFSRLDISEQSGPESRSDTKAIEQRMLAAMKRKNYDLAVDIYERSLQHGLPKLSVQLGLAVDAALHADPDSSERAERLIKDASEAGMNVCRAKIPMLLYDLKRRPLSTSEGVKTALDSYQFMLDNRIALNHHVTLGVIKNLQRQHDTEGALEVVRAVAVSDWTTRKPFDLAFMTMLVQLFIDEGSTESVRATMESVLRRNLRIDDKFTRRLVTRRRDVFKGRLSLTGRSKPRGERAILAQELTEYIKKSRDRRYEQVENSLIFAKNVVEQLEGAFDEPASSDGETDFQMHEEAEPEADKKKPAAAEVSTS